MNDIVIVGGGSISDFTEDNDGTFLFTFTADSDGEKVITSRIVDNAGNTGNASFNFTYDSTVQCSRAEFETITMMTTRNSLEHKNVNCVIARSLTRIKIENDRVHSLESTLEFMNRTQVRSRVWSSQLRRELQFDFECSEFESDLYSSGIRKF